MFKAAPRPDKYLLATTFATLRFDPLIDKDVGGLCTDNLQSCFCLILVGVSGRISLTHTNFNIDMDFIREELRWVKEVKTIYIVKNCNLEGETNKEIASKYMAFFMTDFLKILKSNAIDDKKMEVLLNEHGFAAVDRSGKFIRLPLDFTTEAAPYKFLREAINLLNHFFEGANLACDIQYLNGQWSACPELSVPAKKVIDHCRNLIKINSTGNNFNYEAQGVLIADHLKKMIVSKDPILKRRFDFQGKDIASPQVQQFIAQETNIWSTKILAYIVFKEMIGNARSESYAIKSVLTNEQLVSKNNKEQKIEEELNKPAVECLKKKEESQLRKALSYLQQAEISLKESALEDSPYGAGIYSNCASCYRDLYKLTNEPALLDTAIKYCEKSLAIRKKYFSNNSEQVENINKKLAECTNLKSSPKIAVTTG